MEPGFEGRPFQIRFPSAVALTAFAFTFQITGAFKGCWFAPIQQELQACDFKYFQVVFLRSA